MARILESREPLLTHIARLITSQMDVELLVGYLLNDIPPYGPKFIAAGREEGKEWSIIALEAMRKWCDSVREPSANALHKILESIHRLDIVRMYESDLTDSGSTAAAPTPRQNVPIQESGCAEPAGLDRKVLVDISNGLSTKWECVQLAVRLELKDDEIRRFQSRLFDDDLGFDMLQKWQTSKGSKATGEVLHQALIDIGRTDLAQRCEHRLLN